MTVTVALSTVVLIHRRNTEEHRRNTEDLFVVFKNKNSLWELWGLCVSSLIGETSRDLQGRHQLPNSLGAAFLGIGIADEREVGRLRWYGPVYPGRTTHQVGEIVARIS
jgi:hypothetical protein